MTLDIAGRARLELERIDAWWRANRDHQDLFEDELADAEEFRANAPELAAVYVVRGRRKVRWLLLPKTEVKPYFWVDEKQEIVHVVLAWGRPPRSRPEAVAKSGNTTPLLSKGIEMGATGAPFGAQNDAHLFTDNTAPNGNVTHELPPPFRTVGDCAQWCDWLAPDSSE